MTGALVTLTDVLDRVQSIIQTVGTPLILWMFGFWLLSLFLWFRSK